MSLLAGTIEEVARVFFSSTKMLFILVVALIAVPSLADSTEKSADQCPETVDKTLLSGLYRSSYLQSPLYRFKVLDGEGRPPKPQFKEPQDFYALREKCLEDGQLFEDPEFEAVESSLFFNKSSADDYDDITWLRPHEIIKNPQFIVNGTSRSDVKQGNEGDCWFMAVLANVASNEAIISQNVPNDQSFTHKYCGIFHFRFWQMGHWIDVVIDDRLPVRYGRLFFAESSQENEFWAALLEKAYAKLYGSYEALSGGYEYEAMEDLTGGVVATFNLNELLPIPNLFKIMQMALKYHSVITAEIEKDDEKEAATIVKKGLGNNHAYSITNVKSLEITKPKKKETVSLVRVRNPWGIREWKGPWHDSAREWDFVSEKDKKELGLKIANDGEYWMTYNDFIETFDGVSVCLIDLDMLPAPNVSNSELHWDVNVFKGEWVRGVTAGGCRVDTLHQNPQYQVTIEETDQGGKLATLFVNLIQESQRALRNFNKQEENYLPLGFVIYKSENSTSPDGRLSAEYIGEHKWFETSQIYSDWRDVTRAFKVPPGVYTIIPCTFHSNIEGEFVLRVVTATKNSLKSL